MESKFGKSMLNKGTENSGLALLLTDRRFQGVDLLTKRRLLELIDIPGAYGTQTFDAVLTDVPVEPLHLANIDEHFSALALSR